MLFWNSLVNIRSFLITEAQICFAQTYRSIGDDNKKAMYWAKKATESQNARSFTLIGLFYEDGIGADKAMKWHKLSLIFEKGSKSSFYIGKLYYFGKDVKKNHKLAFDYFNLMLSHDGQYAATFFYVGEIFEKGEDGVSLNYQKALEYYHTAFDLDCSKAAIAIGFMYHGGLGVEKDFRKAFEWFSRGIFHEQSIGIFHAWYLLPGRISRQEGN